MMSSSESSESGCGELYVSKVFFRWWCLVFFNVPVSTKSSES